MNHSKIKLADNTISGPEIARLCEWMQSGNQLTKGPVTRDFERQFAEFYGVDHALFVNSGSSANLVLAYGLKLTGKLKNNRVVVPAVSWVTTVAPYLQLGFDVVLCDCDPKNLGLNLNHLEKLIRDVDPALVVAVNVLGHANDYAGIKAMLTPDCVLLEDNCEGFGSRAADIYLGTHGLGSSFSFYYGHHLSTIEGGMVITDDKDLLDVMTSVRSHGWNRDLTPSASMKLRDLCSVDEFRDLYTFYFPGFNLRSTDLQAKLGIGQLEKAEFVVQKRQRLFEHYRANLGHKFFVQESEIDVISSFAFGTLVTDPASVSRHLAENGIESRPLICGNIGRQPFWLAACGASGDLPFADLVHDHGIYLPIHCGLDDSDVEFVCDKFMEVAKEICFPSIA